MDESTSGAAAGSGAAASWTASDLARALGVKPDTAERLLHAGLSSPESAREASAADLDRAGIPADEVERIHSTAAPSAEAPEAEAPAATVVDSEQIVERWVGTVRRPERSRRRKLPSQPKESADVLRKWVDGDDRAMEDWIRSSEPDAPAALPPLLPSAPATEPAGPAARPPESGAIMPVLEREETVVRWLTGLLDRVKSDQFDPSSMIQEAQDLHRQLYDERTKRKTLEDEVEHVKRGSIAVIKYVRSREAKEREIALRTKDDEIAELKLRLLALEGVSGSRPTGGSVAPGVSSDVGSPTLTADAVEKATRELDQRLREEFTEREGEYVERETELRRRIVQLEGDIRTLTGEAQRAKEREELLAEQRGPMADELTRRLEEVTQREKDLVGRENELRSRFEEIRINAEELERRRGPIEAKERDLAATDQQLQTRRQALDIEARRLEEVRREVGATGTVAPDEARRLAELRHELARKEAELRARESQVATRLADIERMAGTGAEEAEARQVREDATTAAAEIKVKSGVRRLDDLLYGGFSAGVQVLLNGPAHTGKDVLARLFSVEGLKFGIPSIWVVTDKTYQQVRDDLAALYPGFPDAEKKGMVRYVDLYSRQVGSAQSSANVRLLSTSDKALLDQLAQSVNGYAEELKEKFPAYRLVFESVSTITAYLDSASSFRFLQPFIGRRKLDGAVAYYVLDSGMHSESDLETLEHMVDGSLNFKVEQMKTFLSVRGVGEAQARAWIGYTFNKRAFNLGSFSLEHIR
jgi:KaiC/GvpD/RAD55 family RecA-like ATPase